MDTDDSIREPGTSDSLRLPTVGPDAVPLDMSSAAAAVATSRWRSKLGDALGAVVSTGAAAVMVTAVALTGTATTVSRVMSFVGI
ncbi:hypothetical protein [Rhodococcus rhodochrous]|uniref:Uncharacterized protein n=1 Tax=Rhodococcus rhodochrous KG-21 TaxID=1441923 RepID=A0A0N0S0L9_RHORH|nr:hypothetical protein [Rhodococcus rhodochrous]KOS54920.1 hypothetical protein Z051_17745 [Rhodococcus rhodochrous KG-21]